MNDTLKTILKVIFLGIFLYVLWKILRPLVQKIQSVSSGLSFGSGVLVGAEKTIAEGATAVSDAVAYGLGGVVSGMAPVGLDYFFRNKTREPAITETESPGAVTSPIDPNGDIWFPGTAIPKQPVFGAGSNN
ncbi:MAG TPA: hypothetical protein VN516_10655 [Candidatus Baltobacteraceae bacterium]|nr:hypothetical protein [Candidatus Baltobacteraceae bacterium]